MSSLAESWVEQHYRAPASTRRGASQRKFVLYMIARSANPQGEARESVPSIAVRVDQDVRTVQRHLRELQREGVLLATIAGNGISTYHIVPVARLHQPSARHAARPSCEHRDPICDACFQKRLTA